MARNSEKANFMLNRWLSVKEKISKASFEGKGRYSNTKFTNNVKECEKIRFEIMGEISSRVNKLTNNLFLCEGDIRTKNLEINELLKEKYKWECRIVELGGPNYKSKYSQYIESLGGIAVPNSVIKVFGIAKTLPEYKEALSIQTQQLKVTEADNNAYEGIVLSEEYYGELDKEMERLISSKEEEKELDIKKRKQSERNEDLTNDILFKLIENRRELLSSV